jgi:hypothetical protein
MVWLLSKNRLATTALGVALGCLTMGHTTLAQVQPPVAFAAFTGAGEKDLGDAELEVDGFFTLGGASNGIAPGAETTVVSVGPYTTTIPAGSPWEYDDGEWEFEQFAGGVAWDIEIESNVAGRFELDIDLEGIDIGRVGGSVIVKLSIGNDSGQTTIGQLRVDQD